MELRLTVFVVAIVVLTIIAMIVMLRRRTLEIKYTLVWLFMGVGILIIALVPGLMGGMARLIGVALPVNMLFFMGFIFLATIVFSLTLAISRMSMRIKNIAQSVALLEKEMKELKDLKEEKKS